MNTKTLKLGILGSTRGTDMLALVSAIKQQQMSATLEVVLSNKKDALILARARDFHVPAQFVDPTGLTREAYDQQLTELLHKYCVDLVVLIGYMRILSSRFVNAWRDKIINVHPSLLPAFAGSMNNDVHQQVLAGGHKETGCTVHYVTEDIDAGPVLVQKRCMVLNDDTVESLKARVQELEGNALIEAISNIAAGFVYKGQVKL
jgi:phosphoribosylglycinamide formyltransferase 1